MKRFVFAILFISIAFHSCQVTESIPGSEEMLFAPSINVPTKVTGNSFDVGDVIGLYVARYSGDVAPVLQLGGNYANNVPVTYNGNSWSSSPKLYWDDSKVDVYAFYPRTLVNSIDEYPFSVAIDQNVEATSNELSAYEASDFLWAKSKAITRVDAVPLVFKHKMSKVVVNLLKGTDYEGDIPTDVVVKLHNTVPDALIDLYSGDVIKNPRSSVKTINALNVTQGVFTAIVVPQMLVNRVPLIEVICKGVSYLVESKFNFKSGVCHTIDITLTDNPEKILINIGGEIVGWE